MRSTEFRSRLRAACSDALDAYHSQYPEAPPLPERILDDLGDERASEATIDSLFDALTDFYDDLFEVDSTSYHDEWRSSLVYDCSRREHLALLASHLPESLALVVLEGTYSPTTGVIGLSSGRLTEPDAAVGLAAELCHAYQHRFASPTWEHLYLREGFEQAVTVRAQDHLATRFDSETMIHVAARQRTRTLLEGYLAHESCRGGVSPADVRSLGVTEAELSLLRAGLPWHVLGRVRPRSRWSSTAFLPEYALFGSMLLVSERLGVPDTYARAFYGDHPWTTLIEEIRDSMPWLYRLHPYVNRN